MAKTFGRVTYIGRFDQAREGLRREAAARAQLVGNAIRTAIVVGMTEPKHGRIYFVPGTHRQYQASAPGEYPAIRTGALRTSIKTVFIVNATQGTFSAMTGTHLPYGIFLELGTRSMAPRPWLSRGFREARAKIEKILAMPWKIL